MEEFSEVGTGFHLQEDGKVAKALLTQNYRNQGFVCGVVGVG